MPQSLCDPLLSVHGYRACDCKHAPLSSIRNGVLALQCTYSALVETAPLAFRLHAPGRCRGLNAASLPLLAVVVGRLSTYKREGGLFLLAALSRLVASLGGTVPPHWRAFAFAAAAAGARARGRCRHCRGERSLARAITHGLFLPPRLSRKACGLCGRECGLSPPVWAVA
eukprot:365303-Chlamydomonas_euryale.AAC.67